MIDIAYTGACPSCGLSITIFNPKMGAQSTCPFCDKPMKVSMFCRDTKIVLFSIPINSLDRKVDKKLEHVKIDDDISAF